MSCADNLVLRSMSHFVSFRIKAVSSVYGVSIVISKSIIKDVVWDFFARSVFIILVCLCMFLLLCFGLCCFSCHVPPLA